MENESFPVFRSESYAAEETEDSRLLTVMQLCLATFNELDESGDGFVNMESLNERQESPREGMASRSYSSSSMGPASLDFSGFFKHMTGYLGSMDDEVSLKFFFEQMTSDQFADLLDSFKDEDHSTGAIIFHKLNTISRQLITISSSEFISRLNNIDIRQAETIISNLNILLHISNVSGDDPVIVHGNDRLQRLKAAAQLAFNMFDIDRDGFIVKSEFQQACELQMQSAGNLTEGNDFPKKFAELLMKKCDANHDGKVSFDEFFGFFCLQGFQGDRSDNPALCQYFGSLSQTDEEEICRELDSCSFHLF